jgi:CO/xanthine dehydrogenase FAD-binding subunit
MGNPEKLVTLATQDTGKRLEKTKGKLRMGNPETLVALATQDTGQRLEKTQGQIKNGQYRDTGNIGYTGHREKVREN